MLNRRRYLKSVVGALGAGLLPGVIAAAGNCGNPAPPFGARSCVAGIPQERFDTVFAFQQQTEWCWAARIEMVFAYWDHRISRKEIVKQTEGVVANMPAQPIAIVRDLNRPWTDEDGNSFTVVGDVFSANGFTAIRDLASEVPLIIGSMGHAMVLTAVSFNQAMNVPRQLTGALGRDPWPGRWTAASHANRGRRHDVVSADTCSVKNGNLFRQGRSCLARDVRPAHFDVNFSREFDRHGNEIHTVREE